MLSVRGHYGAGYSLGADHLSRRVLRVLPSYLYEPYGSADICANSIGNNGDVFFDYGVLLGIGKVSGCFVSPSCDGIRSLLRGDIGLGRSRLGISVSHHDARI